MTAGASPATLNAAETPYGTLAARGAASLIDLVIVLLLEWPVARAVHGTGPASQIVLQFLPALYVIGAYTALGGGQTLGKRWLRLRVVNAQGAPLSLGASVRRWAVSVGVLWPLWWLLPAGTELSMPPASAGCAVIALVLAVIALDSWLLLANRPSRRSLHDLAAGSFVVRRDARAPFPDATPARGHAIAGIVLAVLAGLVSIPLWEMTAVLAPRAVELARASEAIRSLRGMRSATAWPTFSASHADTAWRVMIYAEFSTRRPQGNAAADSVHALACRFARLAPHAVRGSEVAAVTRYAGEGTVPNGLLFTPDDVTPAACAP